jgi:hypothetical protein
LVGLPVDRVVILAFFNEQGLLRGVDTDFREELPADAVDLRESELFAEGVFEHAPEPGLKRLWVCGSGHFVFADQAVWGQHQFLVRLRDGLVPLLAGDIGEYHPVAPRKTEIALEAAVALHQVWVALQAVYSHQSALARLLQGVADGFEALLGINLGVTRGEALEGVQLPVFDLQKQQAPARVQDDVVGVAALAAQRNVIPDGVVVLEQAFQALAQTPFARRHAANGAEAGNHRGH